MTRILISLLLLITNTIADARFTLTLSKQAVYLGEPIKATLTLHPDPKHPPRSISFKGLHTKDFEITPVTKVKDANTTVQQWCYFLIPKRIGNMVLPSQSMEIAYRDPKTYQKVWKTLHTPERIIPVQSLPQGTTLVGNYRLTSSIDKNSTDNNTPLNFTVTIEGSGDLRALPPHTLPLADQMTFASAPTIETHATEKGFFSRYTQHFSILSEESFTLPSLSLHYLNSDTRLEETLHTTPYTITVHNKRATENLYRNIVILLIGLLLGVLGTLLFIKLYTYRKSRLTPRQQSIAKCNNSKSLYTVLLPYANLSSIMRILKELEEKKPEKSELKILKSEAIDALKTLL